MTMPRNFPTTLLLLTVIFLSYVNINHFAQAFPKTDAQQQPAAGERIYGKVTDVMDVSGYTYAEVSDGEKKYWAAGPVTSLKIGDMIAFTPDMPMENYHSKTLNRDFEVLYFVEQFITDKLDTSEADDVMTVASPHEQIKQGQPGASVSGINKAEGGQTIAEIYQQKQELKGKTVRIRGQVTKVTDKVMGKNWLHIMDSSSQDDLTVTTQGNAEMDEVIIIEGTLALDKDFSYGYVYPVIVEDARIVRE